MPEAEAVALADAALFTSYQVAGDALALFDVRTSFVETPLGLCWEIVYTPRSRSETGLRPLPLGTPRIPRYTFYRYADAVAYDALSIAREAILQEMPQAAAALPGASTYGAYAPENPGTPAWQFSFFFLYDGMDMDYGVVLSAETGEILLTAPVTGENG